MKEIKINSEAYYEAALRRIEAVFDAAPRTPEGELLEWLSEAGESYEDRVYTIDPLDAPTRPEGRSL